MNVKVLMFGWEYPPVVSGGLGIACHGLSEALGSLGMDVLFLLPRRQLAHGSAFFLFCDAEEAAHPFTGSYTALLGEEDAGWYRDRLGEIEKYIRHAKRIAKNEVFDVIHAHDWKSYLAGIAAKEVSGKPLVVHVHATSFDQSGGQARDPFMYELEKRAFAAADAIVAVSDYTKRMIVRDHDADADKIHVVHNGADLDPYRPFPRVLEESRAEGKKVVLYHGRVTIQKGVDHFIRAAARVLEHEPETLFVVSGGGDMLGQVMKLAAELGIADQVLFVGETWGEERDRLYQSADLVVMPSVSEPFGLVALEAIINKTAALISKQTGISEVVQNVLKVDFWDIDEMANKIVGSLRSEALRNEMVRNSGKEVGGITWSKAAGKCVQLYKKLMGE